MAEAAKSEELHTYRGNCHCGAFVYEYDLPKITSYRTCNCSICTKKAPLMAFGDHTKFRMVKGRAEDLSVYKFGSQMMDHKFCPTCGTALFCTSTGMPGWELGVNIRAIQDLDVQNLEVTGTFDGKGLGKSYEEPQHKGPSPSSDIEGGKTYTGSCHCGALTVALNTKPLDETYDQRCIECACSICSRNGYTWVYPRKEQVVLSGDEADIGYYKFGASTTAKTFCKKCGVQMTNLIDFDMPADQYEALGEEGKKRRDGGRAVHPVNVRVLHGVELDKLNKTFNRDPVDRPPQYVNP